jgi:hypothetical protein
MSRSGIAAPAGARAGARRELGEAGLADGAARPGQPAKASAVCSVSSLPRKQVTLPSRRRQ